MMRTSRHRGVFRSVGKVALLALLPLAIACGGAAEQSEGPAPATEPLPAAGGRLYVASQSSAAVSVIDMSTLEVLETIDLTGLGFTAQAKPHHAAVDPDGEHWYLSLISDWRVLKFDRDNNLVGQAEFETPGMLVADPAENLLYVGRSMAAVNPPQRIGVIDRATMAIEEVDVFMPRPHAIMTAEGGNQVYVASLAVNQMAALQPADEEIELIQVEGDTHTFVQFAISPDGSTLVTGGQMSGLVMVFDLTDPMAPALTNTLEIGGQPWHPTWSPDGRFVYFPQNIANSVAVVDASDWSLAATIEAPSLAEPHGSAISADGSLLFVSGRNTKGGFVTAGKWTDGAEMGTVTVIDTASRQVVKVLEVPPYAAGIGASLPR
jgi:YVTN family beta-propeller protein